MKTEKSSVKFTETNGRFELSSVKVIRYVTFRYVNVMRTFTCLPTKRL